MTVPMPNPMPQDGGSSLESNRSGDGAGLQGLRAGTRIATPSGERSVETLRPGDLVLTADGVARRIGWIGRRRTDRTPQDATQAPPILFRRASIAPAQPSRELVVGPGHAILVDGVLVPASLLVESVGILARPTDIPTTWFHLELDRHDVLVADGTPVESFVDCDSTGMFENAIERKAAAGAPRWIFCAPRVEDGPRLAAIRDRLAARRVPAEAPGATVCLELISHDRLEGHAVSAREPDRALVLEVLLDGGTIGRVRADRPRPDLAPAPEGHHRLGFTFAFASPLAPQARHAIGLRVVGHPAIVATATLEPSPATPTADAAALRRILDDLAAGGVGTELLSRLEASLPRMRATRALEVPPRHHALVLDEHLPAAPTDAPARVAAALLRSGCRVTLASEGLADRGGRFLDHPDLMVAGGADFASLEDVLQRRGADAVLVHVGSSATMSRYAGLIRAHCPAAHLTQGIGRLGPKAVASALSGQADTLLVRGASDAAWLAAQPGAPRDVRLMPPPEDPGALERLFAALVKRVTRSVEAT